MIVPGRSFNVEFHGEDVAVRCLTEDQQCQLIEILQEILSYDEANPLEKMKHLVRSSKTLASMVCPEMDDAKRASLGHNKILELAGIVIAKHLLGIDDKKKLESRHSSDQGSYARVAVPDVLVTTMGS